MNPFALRKIIIPFFCRSITSFSLNSPPIIIKQKAIHISDEEDEETIVLHTPEIEEQLK